VPKEEPKAGDIKWYKLKKLFLYLITNTS